MIGTSDQSCWLAEACKILLLLLHHQLLRQQNMDVLLFTACSTSAIN